MGVVVAGEVRVTPDVTTLTEQWYSAGNLHALGALTARLPRGMAVEVGAWEGRSTLVLAARLRRPLHVVDHWQGSAVDGTDVPAARRDVRATFDANLAGPLATGRVVVHAGDWRDVLPGLLDGKRVAFAHLDAEHDQASVAGQLELLVPAMASRGVLCGHDATHQPVRAALRSVLEQRWEQDGSVWWWRANP